MSNSSSPWLPLSFAPRMRVSPTTCWRARRAACVAGLAGSLVAYVADSLASKPTPDDVRAEWDSRIGAEPDKLPAQI